MARRTTWRRTLLALSAIVALAGCSSSGSGSGDPGPAPTLRPHVGRLPVGPQPDAMTMAFGSIWVADYGGDQVQRVDPRTGKVLARITVGEAPIWLQPDGRWLWVANYQAASVYRIDPRTNRVHGTFAVGNEPEGIAIADGTVWVTNQLDGTLSRLSQRTGRPTGKPVVVGGEPIYVIAAGSRLWLTNSDEGRQTFHRVEVRDARTGRLLRERSFGHEPFRPLLAFGSLWVTDYHDGVVFRLDPDTLATQARLRVGRNPDAVYADRGSVWLDNDGAASLTRIDPHADRVVSTIRLPGAPRSMVRAGATLWVAGFDDGVLYRVPVG